MNSPLSGSLPVTALVVVSVLLAAFLVAVLLSARAARRQARASADATAGLTAALAASEARAVELAERLARLERRSVSSHPVEPVTGRLDHPTYDGEPASTDLAPLEGRAEVDGRLFADIVARETTIRAAGLWHGLRVALTPENRNRIRFQMKQEVKRSRRERRTELKAALRELRARERAALTREAQEEADGEDAA